MAATAPVRFTAQWTHHNDHLKPKELWDYLSFDDGLRLLSDKTFVSTQIIKKFVAPLVGRIVLMAQNEDVESRRKTQAAWNRVWANPDHNAPRKYLPIPLHLTTPDGVQIRGTFYRARNADTVDIPTVVVCMPNANSYKTFALQHTLLNHESPFPFNIVAFDYRGVGESEGSPCRAHDLVLDADTVYQCCREHFGISRDRTRFFGFSLGGAVGTLIRGLYESDAPLVNSHSFSSIEDLIFFTDLADKIEEGVSALAEGRMPQGIQNPITGTDEVSCITQWIAWLLGCIATADNLKLFASWLLSLTEWDFKEIPEALNRIGANAQIIFDEADPLIQGANAAQRTEGPQQRISVRPNAGIDGNRHGGIALKDLSDEQGRPVLDSMLPFLLRV